MKRELLYLGLIFVVLSFIIHYKEFLSFPLEHIQNLQDAGAYGFGFLHPFLFTLLVYIILLIPRIIIKIVRKLTTK